MQRWWRLGVRVDPSEETNKTPPSERMRTDAPPTHARSGGRAANKSQHRPRQECGCRLRTNCVDGWLPQCMQRRIATPLRQISRLYQRPVIVDGLSGATL